MWDACVLTRILTPKLNTLLAFVFDYRIEQHFIPSSSMKKEFVFIGRKGPKKVEVKTKDRLVISEFPL